MAAARQLLTAAIVVLAGLAVLPLVSERLDALDKLASVGSFALAAALALVAWWKRPRAHRPAPHLMPSRHRHDYLKWLIARNRDIDIRGLGTQGPFSLGVESVFVDVSLVPRPIHQATADPLAEVGDEYPERRSVWSFLTAWPPRTLVIVGPPGGGKTTLLKHLTLALASGRGPALRSVRSRVPVLLVIRDHAQAIAADPELPLIRPLMDALPVELAAGETWLARRLAAGGCLVMLDGLDEVAEPDQRRLLSAWVERQIAVHQNNGFILTSRPYGYQANPLNAADVLQVRPFTHDQIEQFLQRWYLATEIRRTGRKDGVVVEDAAGRADDLLQRLRGNPHLYDLAVNPLLLTMIAHVHNYRGVLPGGRAELYREICQVFLGGRQAAKGLTSELTADQRESVLKHLALEMMESRRRDIEAGAAAGVIRGQLARVAPGVRPEVFMLETEQQSGLLLQRESGVYAFAHLTFQEYLPAVRLRERNMRDVLARRSDDPWWREVTLLYCANADAGPIVEACMATDTARSLLLASDCTEVARELDPAIRDRLDLVLSSEAQSADPARAQLIGQVLLARKLRRVRHQDADVVLVDEPITYGEFALFLRDENVDDRQLRPAHWSADLVDQAAKHPVTGLSDDIVRVFCAWLTSADGWTYQYHPAGDDYCDVGFRSGRTTFRPFGELRLAGELRKAVDGRDFRLPKRRFLQNVRRSAGALAQFDGADSEIYGWLAKGVPVWSAPEMNEQLRRLAIDLRHVQLLDDGVEALIAAETAWLRWHAAPERSSDLLLPLIVGLCRLAESVWVTHHSLAPRVAQLLDRVITLYWCAGGLITVGPQLWLRRT